MSIGDRTSPKPSSNHHPLWVAFLAGMLNTALSQTPRPVSGRDDKGALAIPADRGRQADTPSDIPVRGWKDILWRIYAGISDDRIMANAAGVVFYALLALFPGTAAIVSIYGFVGDPQAIAAHVDSLAGILPGGALDVLHDQLNRLLAQPKAKL